MSKTDTYTRQTINAILTSVESLRARLVDLEAMAHSANETLPHIPYLPRRSDVPELASEDDPDVRLQFGRLQSLVVAAADLAHDVMREADVLLRDLREHAARAAGERPAGKNGSGRASNPRARYVADSGDPAQITITPAMLGWHSNETPSA